MVENTGPAVRMPGTYPALPPAPPSIPPAPPSIPPFPAPHGVQVPCPRDVLGIFTCPISVNTISMLLLMSNQSIWGLDSMRSQLLCGLPTANVPSGEVPMLSVVAQRPRLSIVPLKFSISISGNIRSWSMPSGP
ncbi:hypothetical protein QCA50_007093 [Cerrena zonata]|uniref:Uncharacterized protein n=1 Tax=Cerrena zonata TaxID=2478898 RepID=A0AAW0GA71_9APHY